VVISHPEGREAPDVQVGDLVPNHPLHHSDEGGFGPLLVTRTQGVVSSAGVKVEESWSRGQGNDPMANP
jgi:hypothetical protein